MIARAKTCVYAIALNEIKHVDRFMKANKDADLVLICDTGSTDGTVERLRELGAVVYEIKQKPWRFDVPRNTALSLVPIDIDFCLSIDIDEYLQPGWNEALQEAWQRSNGTLKRIAYDYIWNWKEDGITPDVRYFQDKMHHRIGYRWKHPCHETLYWEGEGDEIRVDVPGIILHHRADVTKSRGQYIDLLKQAVDEDPTNDRMRHYYARELMFYNRSEESIEQFKIHLSMPSSTWDQERCASMRYMSRCYRNLNNFSESQNMALKAVMECSWTREPWLELARAAYSSNDWRTCHWAATKCLDITSKTMSYIADSAAWGFEIYDHAALSAYHIGFYEKAVEYGKKAVELEPNDQRLKNNLEFYVEKYNP
jgi:glycosyltransferase involved in cell wall biosynthesis